MSLTKWTFCQGRTHWRKSNHETRRLAVPDHRLGIYCGIDVLLLQADLKKEDSLKKRISYLASRISLSYEIRTTKYVRPHLHHHQPARLRPRLPAVRQIHHHQSPGH